MKKNIFLFLFFAFSQLSFSQNKSTIINVDFTKNIGEMYPFWAFFGADERSESVV